jgi:hypothetical protein
MLRTEVCGLWIALAAGCWLLSAGVAEAGTVHAADFGFHPSDATAALQAAIDSGANRVIVSNMGTDWIIRPVFLRSPHQEIVFERGVVVRGKTGAFPNDLDALLTIDQTTGVTLRGYGATLTMPKATFPDDTEHRHLVNLLGATDIKVYGLTLKDSGGDGIYLGVRGRPQKYNLRVHIRDVVVDNATRNAISVIGARDLLVEDSVLLNSRPHEPMAGMDFEPNGSEEQLVGILVRNVVARNNELSGFTVAPSGLRDTSEDVSIRFEHCFAAGSNKYGLTAGADVGTVEFPQPGGLVEFVHCVAKDNTYALRTKNKDFDAYQVRVAESLLVGRPASSKPVGEPGSSRQPIWVLSQTVAKPHGGVVYDHVTINDTVNRAFLAASLDPGPAQTLGVRDLSGDITVNNPLGARFSLGTVTANINLTVVEHRVTAPTLTLTAPAMLAEAAAGAVRTITASVQGVAVSGVRFEVRKGDAVIAAWEDQASPYAFLWNTAGLAGGVYVVWATAASAATPSSFDVDALPLVVVGGLHGDLNEDDQVTLADLHLLLRMLTGQEPPNDTAKVLAAPADRLTLADARELVGILVGS